MGPRDVGVGWEVLGGLMGKPFCLNCIVHIKSTTTGAKARGGRRQSGEMAGMSWQAGGGGSEDSKGIKDWGLGIPWPARTPHPTSYQLVCREDSRQRVRTGSLLI